MFLVKRKKIFRCELFSFKQVKHSSNKFTNFSWYSNFLFTFWGLTLNITSHLISNLSWLQNFVNYFIINVLNGFLLYDFVTLFLWGFLVWTPLPWPWYTKWKVFLKFVLRKRIKTTPWSIKMVKLKSGINGFFWI